MTRLALLADLHFGRVRADTARHLVDSLEEVRPDRILVAGDFVQRARSAHFRPARAFLDALPAPWHAVPGNHDLPLYNLPRRLLAPRASYRRWIAAETEFAWTGSDIVVVGLDTTTRWRHQRGWIEATQVRRTRDALRSFGDRMPLILAHHPFHHRESVEKKLMIGAPDALAAWSDCPPHMVLTGHLHEFLVEPFVARKGGGRTLQVHCGTSTSERRRGAENDYALLDIDGDRVTVSRMARGAADGFRIVARRRFRRSAEAWHDLDEDRDRPGAGLKETRGVSGA